MAADSVSTNVFGASVPTSTNAPGGGNAGTLAPGPDSTTSVNQAGHQLTSDLSPVGGTHTADGYPVHHTLAENILGVVDQSGLAHDGVEASAGHYTIVGESPNSTHAGSGTPNHNHGSH